MVYVRPLTNVILEYKDGHKWEGLTVRAKSLSTGSVLDFSKMRDIKGKKQEELTDEEREFVEKMFMTFADAVVSWDLMQEAEKEGDPPVPVPPTIEGIRKQDFEFMVELLNDWIERVMKLAPTVGKESDSGPRYPEPPIPPLGSPSLSLGSISMPS